MLKAAARILDLREAAAERRLRATQVKQAGRLEAVRQVEQIRLDRESELRNAGRQDSADKTAGGMHEASLDCQRLQCAISQMQTLESTLQLELRHIDAERQAHARLLAGIRHKMRFLNGKQSASRRRALRRRTARDLADGY